jgi:hypothetical protein
MNEGCKNYTNFSIENLKRRDHLGDMGVDLRIKLKWILKE